MSHRERIDRIEPTQIDRLVDGELSERERRALLGRFDAEPDGWRRCALAFLEAQCWREALAAPPSDSALGRAVNAKPAASVPVRRSAPLWRVLNWAAAVLIAFTLGWLAGGGEGWQRITAGGGSVAEQQRAAPTDIAPGTTPEGATNPFAGESEEQAAPDEGTSRDADALLATVSFADAGDEAAQVQVPVYEGPEYDEAWLRDQPPAVPEYVRRQWERRGYKVLQQRWLLPFELEDGRQVVLPVDEVNVQFVGYEAL